MTKISISASCIICIAFLQEFQFVNRFANIPQILWDKNYAYSFCIERQWKVGFMGDNILPTPKEFTHTWWITVHATEVQMIEKE